VGNGWFDFNIPPVVLTPGTYWIATNTGAYNVVGTGTVGLQSPDGSVATAYRPVTFGDGSFSASDPWYTGLTLTLTVKAYYCPGAIYTPTPTSTFGPSCPDVQVFGKTTTGSYGNPAVGYVLASGFDLTEKGNLYQLSDDFAGSGGQASMALYADDGTGNGPSTLIVQSAAQTVTAGWNHFLIPSTTLDVGRYWIATLIGSGVTGGLYETYLSSGGGHYALAQAGTPGNAPASAAWTKGSDYAWDQNAGYCAFTPHTPTPTATSTFTVTSTPTASATTTPTVTATFTPTATASSTPSSTMTDTATPTPSSTPTATVSSTATSTASSTSTATPTVTTTASPTSTLTVTPTPVSDFVCYPNLVRDQDDHVTFAVPGIRSKVRIFTLGGELVTVLEGPSQLVWNLGSRPASGLYMVELESFDASGLMSRRIKKLLFLH
jgi:hypothetical protein